MSNYTFFDISVDWSSKPAITFDNLPRAMEYMTFLEEQGGTAELWARTHAWNGTFLHSTELYAFTSAEFHQRLDDEAQAEYQRILHTPFRCTVSCECTPDAVWEIGG